MKIYNPNEFEVIGDNRTIFDDTNQQKLTEVNISDLKKEGATGDDIIQKLIENSATYGMKT